MSGSLFEEPPVYEFKKNGLVFIHMVEDGVQCTKCTPISNFITAVALAEEAIAKWHIGQMEETAPTPIRKRR
jgi:hypothetical protein